MFGCGKRRESTRVAPSLMQVYVLVWRFLCVLSVWRDTGFQDGGFGGGR